MRPDPTVSRIAMNESFGQSIKVQAGVNSVGLRRQVCNNNTAAVESGRTGSL